MISDISESPANLILGVLLDMRGTYVGAAFLSQVTGSTDVPKDIQLLRDAGHAIEAKFSEENQRLYYRIQ